MASSIGNIPVVQLLICKVVIIVVRIESVLKRFDVDGGGMKALMMDVVVVAVVAVTVAVAVAAVAAGAMATATAATAASATADDDEDDEDNDDGDITHMMSTGLLNFIYRVVPREC